MEKLLISVLLVSTLVAGFPADPREDTHPFDLGNVGLDPYYKDKYNHPGPGVPTKKAPPEENMFLEEDSDSDAHAIFRSKREASPQHHHHGGYHHGGHHHGHGGHYNPPSYGHHHHNTGHHHGGHHGSGHHY